jgi:hypothetical protein
LKNGFEEVYKQKKRKYAKKTKKIRARKTAWIMHRNDTLLMKYNAAEVEKVINTRYSNSDEETEPEEETAMDDSDADEYNSEAEESKLPENCCKFVTKRKGFRSQIAKRSFFLKGSL